MQEMFGKGFKPLTQDEIAEVIDAEENKSATSRVFFNYGRLRHEQKLPRFESELEKAKKKQQEAYKRKILNEIQQNKEAYQESNSDTPYYYLYAIKHRETGRTMQIAIPGYGEKPRLYSILIEESKNPEFFAECLKNYKPF